MIVEFIDTIVPERKNSKTIPAIHPVSKTGKRRITWKRVYEIHQFEKQEMIDLYVKPEESPMWFDKLWQRRIRLIFSVHGYSVGPTSAVPVRILN